MLHKMLPIILIVKYHNISIIGIPVNRIDELETCTWKFEMYILLYSYIKTHNIIGT